MVGTVKWEDAKRLYIRGIITKAELAQSGINYIMRDADKDAGLLRAAEVDAFFEENNLN